MSVDTQSRSRRKPLRTYKSPAVGDQIIIPQSTVSSPSSSAKGKSTKCSVRANDARKDNITRPDTMARYQCPQSPPLPLFHPLGKLAMSLPPLDPTAHGLPLLAIPDDLQDKRRSIHGAGKRSREAEDDGECIRQGMSAVAAVAAREKASPRKRRTGGGNKRRRKDGDDGDASYPAKRTRIQRGQNGEEETGVDSLDIGGDGTLSEMVEKRRSARSRGGTTTAVSTRRSSSSSGETTPGINDAGSDMIVASGQENKANDEEGEL